MRSAASTPSSAIWLAIWALTNGSTSLNTLRPFCMNRISRRSSIASRVGRKKPLLLRILFENWVAQRVERTLNPSCPSSRSSRTAVATSPKMKWQSRSRHSRWPEVISGEITSARFTDPARIMSAAVWMPNVAEEQATFMSKAMPPAPMSC